MTSSQLVAVWAALLGRGIDRNVEREVLAVLT
jgi:hypothetical protein